MHSETSHEEVFERAALVLGRVMASVAARGIAGFLEWRPLARGWAFVEEAISGPFLVLVEAYAVIIKLLLRLLAIAVLALMLSWSAWAPAFEREVLACGGSVLAA
jgi:hypothetical protein